MTSEPIPLWRRTGLLPLAVAVLAFLAFRGVGEHYLDSYRFALGSLSFPRPTHAMFMLSWALFGSLAAGFGAFGLARLASLGGIGAWIARRVSTGPDRPWVLAGMALALAIPLLIRGLVLLDMPLTDDEACYRFMAELLASGRVYADSPPGKLHFDMPLMVNDGRWYSQYFLGWPLLLAPGALLGVTGSVNAVYAALTVPALYGILRRVTDRGWARAVLVVYLSSPFTMAMAATELAHTSCLMALSWAAWCWLRTRDEAPPLWSHAGLAVGLSLAFMNRPLTVVGIGAPMVLAWLWQQRRARGRELALRAAAFGMPAALLAGLFFWFNQAQTGSALTVAYQAARDYQIANDYRFAIWPPGEAPTVSNMRPHTLIQRLAELGVGGLRLNFALFGWPSSFALALCSGLLWRKAWPWALSVLCFGVLYSGVHDPGVDTIGPNHYAELALPVLVLTAIGLKGLTDALRSVELPGLQARALPAALLTSLIILTLVGYAPARFGAVHRAAQDIAQPFDAVEQAGVEDVVIFTYRGFINTRHQAPGSISFVRWHPIPSPDLDDPVLWVNHLDIPSDKAFMSHFPDRRGYVLVWKDDQPVFLPLDSLQEGDLPANEVLKRPKG